MIFADIYTSTDKPFCIYKIYLAKKISVKRNNNDQTSFTDFERLFIIASLKRAGMSIKQIREFTVLCDQGDPTIAQRLKIIMDQREAVEEQITELQDAMDVLKYKNAYEDHK